MTHICVTKLSILGSDNGLLPGRRQAIIWTNAGILLIGHLGTNFSEIFIGIQTFSFTKMHLKMSSAKWRPFCLGLNVLTNHNETQESTKRIHNVWGVLYVQWKLCIPKTLMDWHLGEMHWHMGNICTDILILINILILGWSWPSIFVVNNILTLGIWRSSISHLPGCFMFLDLLSEYRIQHGANGPLNVTSSYSTWMFCRGLCNWLSLRRLVSWINHLPPVFLYFYQVLLYQRYP